MEILEEDRRGTIAIDHPHYDLNSQVRLYAVAGLSPNETYVGAESPGAVQGYFGRRLEHPRGLFADQKTLATWSGNVRAKENNPIPRVSIPLSGNLKLDSVPQSRILMSLTSQDNNRGYTWASKQFLPYATTVFYDSQHGMALTQIEAESIVNGIGGSAITFPLPEPTPTPPPPPIDDPPDDTIIEGDGFGTVYVATSTRLGRTRDFSISSPTYADITPAGVTTVYDFVLDPWRPTTVSYISTDLGVHRGTSMDAASPTWTLILSNAQAKAGTGEAADASGIWKIMCSINQDNYFASFFSFGNQLRCIYTEDAGSSWTYGGLVTGLASFGIEFQGAADIVPHTVQNSLWLFACGRVTGGNVVLYRSADKGQTWVASIGSPPLPDPDFAVTKGICLHCPYEGNEGGSIVYFGPVYTGGGDGWSYKTADLSTVSLLNAGTRTGAKRGGLGTYTQDSNRVQLWRNATPELQLSTDGGSSFSPATATNIDIRVYAAGGFPYNNEQYYAVNTQGIYVSIDNGASFLNRTGDFQTSVGALSSIAADPWGGYGVIVPVWVDE